MKELATLLILIALGVLGCGSLTEQSAGPRDHLVGWYKLPNRHYRTREVIPGPGTLIPVFKADGNYYSVCHGFEAPLKECPEGLEWALAPSSMAGTKIGFDEEANEYYIIIEDAKAQYEGDWSTSGEKQYMTRVERPSWLLDATAEPPRTNDDFIGSYKPVWFPIPLEIRKEGKEYLLLQSQEADEPGVWKNQIEVQGFTPIADRLGLMSRRKDKYTTITYNKSLKRFELMEQRSKRRPEVIRIPLARVSPHPERAAITPLMIMGIPSWN
ncbi:MAG: hypothetical protein ACYS9C_10105 [Planctomycetota bacterium]